MARLVGYQCKKCKKEDEELFNDTDDRPEILDRKCDKCGGILIKNDRKQNSHRVNIFDRGGF